MIQRLVAQAVRLPYVVIAVAVLVIVAGLGAFSQLDIEAYPNPVPPLVEVITQPPGWSAEEVERYVSVPIEVGLSGMEGVESIRSQSIFGLSDVKCYFKWGTDYTAARQEVINRLQFIELPPGVQPQISPWNAIGEIFRYTVEGKDYSQADRKTQQDWVLERQFRQVPGIIDVAGFGGETRQYQVSVDPLRLRGHGVTLSQLMAGLANSNQNAGGQRVFLGEQTFNVRGVGLLRNVHDIENVMIAEQKGTPVRVKDVAEVQIGAAPRLGKVGHDDDPDVVQGIILMRYGAETKPSLAGVHAKLETLRAQHVLPPGMQVAPLYDRGGLVDKTTHTVLENMLVGMGLVTIILLIFLGNLRAAVITAMTIPIALLVAIAGMVLTGTPANLISLGAVDFGIVVDATVIMVENIFRHLGPHGQGSMRDRVLASASEVGAPMMFSTVIIAVAFLPLFTLTGVEGVIFSPMARTYAFAIGGAILLAITLTPVLAFKLMPLNTEEREGLVLRGLHRIYHPVVALALRYPRASVALAVVPIAACVVLFPMLGREFMPKLEEGNLWIRATLPTSIAMQQSSNYVDRMRRIVRGCPSDSHAACTEESRKYPMVRTVISQLGRPDDGTDISGYYNIELFAPLTPFESWPRGMNKAKLTEELTRELSEEFPGVVFNFSQMISDNVEEALSGIKGENSIKIVGPDLKASEAKGQEILAQMASIPGVKDLGMMYSLGQPDIRISIDREACARYGLNASDVNAVVQAAIGGQPVTQVYEGEKHFDLTVRWLEPYRNSLESIREITVSAPDGTPVPLGQLSTVTKETGPSIIYREDGKRYVPIKFSVRGRDLGSTVGEAEAAVNARVGLPYDVHLEWSGQMRELSNAMGRLRIIIPLTLLLIAVLVYSAVKSWVDMVIVLLSIPVAVTGGMLALLVTGINFSVSAAMGFISIFGIAIQDAILVVTYYQRLREEGRSVEAAAGEAADKRFRPALMTALVATVGLLPAALSNGIGAQTQKPLAVVVIGGCLILAMLSRVLRPPMLVVAHRFWDVRPVRE